MRTAAIAIALAATVALTACGNPEPESRYEYDYQQQGAVRSAVLQSLLSSPEMENPGDERWFEYLVTQSNDIAIAITEDNACETIDFDAQYTPVAEAIRAGCAAYDA